MILALPTAFSIRKSLQCKGLKGISAYKACELVSPSSISMVLNEDLPISPFSDFFPYFEPENREIGCVFTKFAITSNVR